MDFPARIIIRTMNKTKRYLNSILLPILTIAVCGLTSLAWAMDEDIPAFENQITEIKGIELPELVGVDFDRMSVFVFESGVLAPIPFQFDDITAKGTVYFEKGRFPLHGKRGVFDEHDSLIVAFDDLGGQLPNYKEYGNRVLAEVKVAHADDERYFYVLQGIPGIEKESYVNYDTKTGIVDTSFYTLHTNPEDFLDWKHFMFKAYKGDQEKSLVDSLKVRMNAGIMAKLPRVTLDNRDMTTKIVDVKHGPLRTTVLLDIAIKVLNVSVVYIDMQYSIYPQEVGLRFFVDVPPIFAKMLSDPNVSISIDGNELKGAAVRSALGPREPVIVDGKMSPNEKELVKQGVDNNNTWIWCSTRRDFDILANFYIPEDFKVPVDFHYQDDKGLKDKPEVYPGQFPNIGYYFNDVPVDDTFDFSLNIFFATHMGFNNPERYSHFVKLPPNISTDSNYQAVQYVKNTLQ